MRRRYLLVFILLLGFVTAQNSIVKQFSSAIADVAEKANPAVVTISAEKVIKLNEQYRQFNEFPFFHTRGTLIKLDPKRIYIWLPINAAKSTMRLE